MMTSGIQFNSEGVSRQHLITRQDLHNIKLQYKIIRQSNDLESVSAWVEEMKELKYNPVLLFKKQGEEQTMDMDNLADKDFIQTEFQKDILQNFGSDAVP